MSEPRPLTGRILLVDDEPAVTGVLAPVLEGEGHVVDVATCGDEALRLLAARLYELVLVDVRIPAPDGLAVLTAGRSLQPVAQFVLITGHATIDSAVEAMRLGAFDYVTKPVRVQNLLRCVDRALTERAVRLESAHRVAQSGDEVVARVRARFVGRSPALERAFVMLARVAPMRASVLLSGETGTGKELAARAIHDLSPRATGPFVAVNCSAIAESLLESELFGHQKGAFTGAVATRQGVIEAAHGGTLFLDEISTVSPAVQVKLLRVLQDRVVQRVGGGPPTPVDFRLVAAANVDLEGEVAAGRFREDLFYRLNVFPVCMPALRERAGDVRRLALYFRARFAEENGIEPPEITAEALDALEAYDWPGNVRQLQNTVERLLIVHAGAPRVAFVPPAARTSALASPGGGEAADRRVPPIDPAAADDWSLERVEREHILRVVAAEQGHQARAAERLGIDRRTLYRKLREFRAEG